jgi:signal transduction histidine kinase
MNLPKLDDTSLPVESDAGLDSTTLQTKYRVLAEKYRALVQRHADYVEQRVGMQLLSTWALRTTPCGLALVMSDKVAFCNALWKELGGHQPAGRRWRQLQAAIPAPPTYFSLDDLAAHEAARWLADGDSKDSLRYFHCLDSDQEIEVRFDVAHQTEKPLVVVVATDVTEQRRTQDELVLTRRALLQKERMRVLGEIASGVVHDLGNALSAAGIRLATLRMQPLPEEAQGLVEKLDRIMESCISTLGRVQDFSRPRMDSVRESCELPAVVHDAIEMIQPSANRKTATLWQFELDAPDDVPPVRGAAPELRHVFLNLLLNARDAMPDGGTVRIALRRSGPGVVATVADQGSGIPAENLGKVFDAFFTTKSSKGMGMGLAIARSTLKRLGGSLGVQNGPEGGAVFTLTVPVASLGHDRVR